MKLAFIGAGRVVNWQLEELQNSCNTSILGAYDSDPKVNNRLREHGCNLYSSLDTLLEDSPDIIAISTPSQSHSKIFKELVERVDSSTIITIEKPTFLAHNQFEKAICISAEKKIRVLPIFQNRYNKAIQHAKQLISLGQLGDILHGRITLSWCRPQRYYDQADWRGKWASDGGALTNQGIHYLDLTRYLFGEMESVIFNMDRVSVDIQCENIACGILRTINGRLISVDISTVSRPNDHKSAITIYGEKGYISIGGLAANNVDESSLNIPDDASEEVSNGYGYGHRRFYEAVSEAVLRNDFSNILSSLEDSKKTHELLHAAYTSALLDGARVSCKGPFIDALGSYKHKITFK